MSNALLSSKVVIQEEEPRIRSIDAVHTSIVAAVGVTERGPIAEPTLVTSFEEFVQLFGGYTADSDLALAAQGFFENEGQFLYVVRTVHYTDPTNPATKTSAAGTLTIQTAASGPTAGSVTGTNTEPFAVNDGDTLVVDVDGGGATPATFNASAGSRTSGNTETFALADGQTLLISVDGGAVQTVTFLTAEFGAIGAATAAEVAAVINAKMAGGFAQDSGGAVVVTSDTLGTDSSIEITGGTAAAAFAFPGGAGSGAGNVADASAVTVAEVKTIVEAAIAGLTVNDVGGAVQIVSNTTGASSTIQVDASSELDTVFGLDNATHSGTTGSPVNTLQVDGKTDGAYANTLQILIEDATDGDAEHFNLTVLDDGLIAEGPYANLSMVDTDDGYVETGLADSNLITGTDLDAVASSQRPANGTYGTLAGGDDGLTGLADADFVGSEAGATGIRALDNVQEFNILIVPGQATSAVQNAMITYCEDTRDGSAFAIMDPPAGLSATQIITYFETTAALLGLSEFGAAYWPRVEVLNPAVGVFGDVDRLTVAPSGIIAGVYARTDAARPGGVYDPPAGIEKGYLSGVLGFETDEVLNERKRDLVEPKRINVLTTFPGAPRHIDGSYCLKGGGNFPFVAQRRGAIFIEQSVKNGVEFARNQNNTPKLRRTVERTVRAFLLVQMRNGAFASENPDTAFYVDFSDKLNPATEVNAGRMNGKVGLAFNTPAVWIVIKFSRDTRALDQEIAG